MTANMQRATHIGGRYCDPSCVLSSFGHVLSSVRLIMDPRSALIENALQKMQKDVRACRRLYCALYHYVAKADERYTLRPRAAE